MKFTALMAVGLAAGFLAYGDSDSRIRDSADVLHEIMQAPDNSIPQDLLQKAACVGVIPNLKKGGFIVGAKYGKGLVTCRVNNSQGWSAPSNIIIEGGSVGFQIGAGETDVVFIVMNQRGERDLMQDKFTLGANAGVMAGPVGRSASAETDAQLHAEILSYSRSRGVFAGIALNGSTLRPDTDANHQMYGPNANQQDILDGKVKPPAVADQLYRELNRYAGVSTNHVSQ